jgi:signal transduction histidine kinase
MKSTTVYLVQLTESAREMAMQAAREALPRAQLVPARSVSEAAQLPGQGLQLLVLGSASEADIGLAAQTLDARELPRWAVVRLGRTPSDLVETVPPEDCSVRMLARIFRSALLQHELLRENLQLRGDLKTISRRLNHDIRTPLGCINTVCSLIKELSSTGSQSPRDPAGVIRDSATEVGVLLDRVTTILRASSEPLPASPVSMGPLVNKALEQLQPAIDRAGLKIRQPAEWPEVSGVDAWIEFIWSNLIDNTTRHGNRNGIVQLGWEARGTDIRFWASSPGMVPLHYQPNLFRPFHLLHQHTSAGLGLSLVERLVSLQGGRCGYEPAEDDRALFFFTLPALPATRKENQRPATTRRMMAGSGAT